MAGLRIFNILVRTLCLCLTASVFFCVFFFTPLCFFQSPAVSTCLQSERQNESSRGITSLSTECQKYLFRLAVFHSFVFCIIHITMTLSLSGENLISPKFSKGRKGHHHFLFKLHTKQFQFIQREFKWLWSWKNYRIFPRQQMTTGSFIQLEWKHENHQDWSDD